MAAESQQNGFPTEPRVLMPSPFVIIVITSFRLCHALDRLAIDPKEHERVSHKHDRKKYVLELGNRAQKEEHDGKHRDEDCDRSPPGRVAPTGQEQQSQW
jgi:hypothetical protein